ncbi:hypothetical protein CN692_13240 [Bacillus sp. AFS002410]|uniref:hypothetical protein n=1 Tax=Bacillus sp. AFS002410 TaxID=2033481 RepID=UPI000BF163A7|nr:hypothetical protein [Bacillus sp. AFS002410]PEJ57372.1 hypothetical protein CN692_13240 [Bacillus sp. AFS002410]
MERIILRLRKKKDEDLRKAIEKYLADPQNEMSELIRNALRAYLFQEEIPNKKVGLVNIPHEEVEIELDVVEKSDTETLNDLDKLLNDF